MIIMLFCFVFFPITINCLLSAVPDIVVFTTFDTNFVMCNFKNICTIMALCKLRYSRALHSFFYLNSDPPKAIILQHTGNSFPTVGDVLYFQCPVSQYFERLLPSAIQSLRYGSYYAVSAYVFIRLIILKVFMPNVNDCVSYYHCSLSIHFLFCFFLFNSIQLSITCPVYRGDLFVFILLWVSKGGGDPFGRRAKERPGGRAGDPG